MNAKIICLDFDDTVNNYPGWEREGYAIVRGEPCDGAKEKIKSLRDNGYIVLVHSVRCGYTGGMVAVVEYLNKYNIRVDGVCSNKPPADIYLDDRSITFEGDWEKAVKDIQAFSTWKDKLKAAQESDNYHESIGYTAEEVTSNRVALERASIEKLASTYDAQQAAKRARQCSTCNKRFETCGKEKCYDNGYNEWEQIK